MGVYLLKCSVPVASLITGNNCRKANYAGNAGHKL
jgi:hypothetical protein